LQNDAEKLCEQKHLTNTSFQSSVVVILVIDCNLDTYKRVQKPPAVKCIACIDAKATMM
jgi:hypothetical protein